MKITYKQLSWGGGALLLSALAATLFYGCGAGSHAKADTPEEAPNASVVKVTRTNLSTTLEIASEFQPFQEINLYAKVSGYIQKLNVDWGTHVKTGDVMAILEIPELEQQLQVDEANVHRSEQALESAHDELNRAQSSYNVAHITYMRMAGVQKTNPLLISQQDIDVAQGKDQETDAAVSAAKDGLAAAQQALAASKATLDKDKALFAYSRITAPFDGVVTQMNAFTGALLPAGTSSDLDASPKGDVSLCRLSQNDLLRLVIPVPEVDVPSIHVGEMLMVKVTALQNKSFPGKIVRFSDQIDLQTRTMHTEVQVPNPKYEIVPGMYANVDLPVQTADHALAVPIQAVQVTKEGKGTVLVVNDRNQIEAREVGLGLQTANQIEITSGLHENESVIFGEQSQFRPGELVKPTMVDVAALE